ncbi:MAG TPA: pyridoxal-dependent decarboxylase [archaeon]|nr:pyridoxal-dependent decarboxylase [archaeon]
MIKTESLDLENLDRHLAEAFGIIAGHIKNISREPVVPQIAREELYNLIAHELPLEGVGVGRMIDEVRKNILPYCTLIGHPRFLPWILTSPSPAGTIGEILNIGLNQVPALYKGGPAATVLEEIVVKWFGELFGYPENHGGILVSGGTMANLTALAVAREVHIPQAMKKGLQRVEKPLTLYVSDQGHVSVERSAGMLGIGSEYVRKIGTDSEFKMRVDCLGEQLEKDRQAGFDPFCVVAQAGAVNTGSVDPIAEMADICAENNIWLHVDASYGGGVILTSQGMSILEGIERADSIATDPHKWFFIPVEAGLTLVKNRRQLYDTFKCEAGYLGQETSKDYMNFGFQLTRSSRALKIWFAFRAYGLHRISRIVEQNLALAQEFRKKLGRQKVWELAAPVELSIVCFRYVPGLSWSDQELDSLQYRILAELEAGGKAFITPAVLNGRVVMRICFANHRTTARDLDIILELLQEIGERIAASQSA